MSTIRKSITFTQQLNDWVQLKVASGDYTNESEYVRDLIRKDKENNSQFMHLKSELQKGIDSGVSDLTVDEIWNEADVKINNEK